MTRSIIIALLLAGCATTPKAEGIRVEIQRVEVPVPVNCLTRDQIDAQRAARPAKPMLTTSAEADLGLVTAFAIQLWDWGNANLAMAEACVIAP